MIKYFLDRYYNGQEDKYVWAVKCSNGHIWVHDRGWNRRLGNFDCCIQVPDELCDQRDFLNKIKMLW